MHGLVISGNFQKNPARKSFTPSNKESPIYNWPTFAEKPLKNEF
jgi:hypothetical protein